MLATAQTQTRCGGDHGLALAIQMQRLDLSRRKHRRRPVDRLLKERPRRTHVGDGAASKALACQTLHSRESDECRGEQPITVRAVARCVVGPLVVRRERPAPAARRTACVWLP